MVGTSWGSEMIFDRPPGAQAEAVKKFNVPQTAAHESSD